MTSSLVIPSCSRRCSRRRMKRSWRSRQAAFSSGVLLRGLFLAIVTSFEQLNDALHVGIDLGDREQRSRQLFSVNQRLRTHTKIVHASWRAGKTAASARSTRQRRRGRALRSEERRVGKEVSACEAQPDLAV